MTVAGALRYRFTTHQASRTSDENLLPDPAADRLVQLLDGEFRQACCSRPTPTGRCWRARADDAKILRRPPTRPTVTLGTTASSSAVLPEGVPVPFLVELGVMTAEGKVRAQRYDKFRQVNRFLELVEDVLPLSRPKARSASSTSAPASRT